MDKQFNKESYGSLDRNEQLDFLSNIPTMIFVQGYKIMKDCDYKVAGLQRVPTYANYQPTGGGSFLFGKFTKQVSISNNNGDDKSRCPAVHFFLVDFINSNKAEIANARAEAKTHPDRAMIAVEVYQLATGDVFIEACDVLTMEEYSNLIEQPVKDRSYIGVKSKFI